MKYGISFRNTLLLVFVASQSRLLVEQFQMEEYDELPEKSWYPDPLFLYSRGSRGGGREGGRGLLSIQHKHSAI